MKFQSSPLPEKQPVPPKIKPEEWLTAKELAAHFGLSDNAAYRWRCELIPDVHPRTKTVLIRYAGTARIFFHVDVIGFLQEQFEARHDGR